MIENFIIAGICVFLYLQLENLVARILVSLYDMCTQENMILNGYRKYMERKLGVFWSKPFVGCPACMVSVYYIIPLTIGIIVSTLTITPMALLALPFIVISGISISIKATKLSLAINKDRFEVITMDKQLKKDKYDRLV